MNDELARLKAELEKVEIALAARDDLPLEQREVILAALYARRASIKAQLAATDDKGESRQLVTVLFADISGFTALSEGLDAEDVHDLLHRLWPRLDAIIIRHGGHVDKHLGDGVMAVWGLEQSREDDPAQAVRAALALQTELAAFRQDQEISLAMRAGLNTGLVSASFVASTGERNLVGDTVNMAARLEQAAPTYGVLIGQSTYDQVRGLFTVEPQPPLNVKGKTEPAQTYLILRERPHVFHLQTRGLAGVTTRTIGRESELEALQTAYLKASEGKGVQWMTVSGEAGVGKSRLLAEFEHWLESHSETVRGLKGRAWPHTQQSPYFLLRDLLSSRFQIRDSDSLAVARHKLVVGFSGVMEEELGDEAAAFIGQLAGFDFRQSPWIAHIAEDTQQIRGRATVLLQEYLSRLCASAPTVLLIEDLHWADEESLILLSNILSEPRPGRLCVVALTRRSFWERKVSWGETASGKLVEHYCRVDLPPLAGKSAQELVYELLQKVSEPPEWLVTSLVERGAGNPYFIEELVHWYIDQGVIATGPHAWSVGEQPPDLSVPATVEGVLQARLDRLGHEGKQTLQQAAVVGRAFWDGAVVYIGQEPVPQGRWQELQRRDMTVRQPTSQLPGEVEYLFRHVLLRDVTYEYTLKKLRRVYHQRAGEWLARAAAERAEEWAAVIATHYEMAEDHSLAAKWYGLAAEQARETDAPEAAIAYYRKALSYLPEGPEHAAHRVIWNEGLGSMLRRQARYAEAAEAYTAALKAAEIAQDLVAQAHTWYGLSNVRDSEGKYEIALGCSQRAEECALEAGAQTELALAIFGKGWAHMRLGDAQAALALSEQALALSAPEEAWAVMARCQNLRAASNSRLGNFELAVTYYTEALELFRKSGDRRRVAGVLNNLAESARSRGSFREAVPLYRDALAIADEIGDRDWEFVYYCNLGGALVGLEEYEAAEPNLRRAIEISETTGSQLVLFDAHASLAAALLGQGRVEEALATAQFALKLALESGLVEDLGNGWRVLGIISARMSKPIPIAEGQCDTADCFAKSLQAFAELGIDAERARTLREWARYETERGNNEKASDMWQEALEIFSKLELHLEVSKTKQEIQTHQGEPRGKD